ncbi:hypothetical protein MCAP1_001307 [Malassezia caprae]|uniref:Transcription initiation factor TFIID subunit 8 n=1 Tax=Malassezia caprae TaxID=1381934 RepID=A0AAF0IVR9_9BASI|nr:hypothetical protein MCAP1_001307 [Malassezia caprae]
MAGVSTYSPVGTVVLRKDACQGMRALIVRIADQVGFDSARELALLRMEDLVEDFIATLLQSCGRFAEVSNRVHPTLYDMIHTFELLGLSLPELHAYANQVRGQASTRVQIPTARPPSGQRDWEHPTALFLQSDDEPDQLSTWKTLMHDIVPDHLPPEPPRHCWMFTPVYATEVLSDMPALQLVNRKLDNARLVESSLRKLIKNTDTAAPVKPWIPLEPAPPLLDLAEDEGDMSVLSVDALPPAEPMVTDVPSTEAPEAGSSAATPAATDDDAQRRRGVLPRAVNYKVSWYASHASTDNKLPTANLYTARLRGNMDESAWRARRYVV